LSLLSWPEGKVKAALAVIDIQVGLVALMPPNLQDQVLSNIAILLAKARSSATRVLFIQHDGPKGHPLETGTPAWDIHPSVLPRSGELVLRKKALDSFFETGFAEELQKNGIGKLIVVGGMTEYCVDTTCRRAVSMGYDVTLVSDAHLTRDTAVLTAPQIIDHHNLILDGFAAGKHAIKVAPTAQISF
jgi:nicotinamidase-related amidase